MKLTFFIMFCIIISVPLTSHALCVKSSVANMRSGPGTQYEKMWHVGRFMPFEKVGSSLSGNWYAVQDVDGDVFWVHRSLLTSEYRCAVVRSAVVNVRKGPGIRHAKVFSEPAQRYDAFRVIGEKGAWIKVRDARDNVGWVHKEYLWVR